MTRASSGVLPLLAISAFFAAGVAALVLLRAPSVVPRTGDPVPDFTLPSLEGEEVTLSKLRGKPVMIEFGSRT